jgi:hypothetical protein
LQISAANLLIAGQQTVRSPQRATPTPALPAAVEEGANAEFSPLDFKRMLDSPASGTTLSVSRPAPSPDQNNAQANRAPGSQLDIRV